MKRLFVFLLALLPIALRAAERVTIVTGANAPALEKRAAGELADSLRKIFDAQAAVQTSLPESGAAILIGSPETSACSRASVQSRATRATAAPSPC